MTDRAELLDLLPKGARRVLAAIETAMGDRSSVAVSYLDFQIVHKLSRLSVTRYLPLLVEVGLLEIEIGAHRGRVYRPSGRWRTTTVDAVRMAVLAHTKPPREGGRGAHAPAKSTSP
jgi:hypothetical protein